MPRVKRYAPLKAEPTPKFKIAAARYLEVLLNYAKGEEGVAAAKFRLAQAGLPSAPAAACARLVSAKGPSAAEIIYPQSGGQTANAGSVMAVVRIHRFQDQKVTSATRTIDIRLKVIGGQWTVHEIASDGGAAPLKPDTSLGSGVINSDRIFMTDTMKWDIENGVMDSRVFEFLKDFSKEHTLKLTVFKTGHPYRVFNKVAVSNHSRGRAFDVWMIDGVTVAEWGNRAIRGNPAHDLMKRSLELGSDETGGPWAFGTRHGATFTDVIHRDHLHIGFKHRSGLAK